jgi:amino acid transporter/nucleotide-binding universal stress UspA family protein
MDSAGLHRPRNVDWKRAGALLYGDWGTSKAYVIGLAFVAAGYSSLPIILAVCALTAVVAYNYTLICRAFPDGGGVYSAARNQSRLLAVIGALMLVADLTVTASMSGWYAMTYFGMPREYVGLATIGLIIGVGAVNFFGPKHSGSLAVTLALPTVVVVLAIILLSLPHLTTQNLEPSHVSFSKNWVAFVGVILALSGVEAVANLTGVMKLNPGSSMDKPDIGRTSNKSIFIVAVEVVFGTALLGWAMLSLPKSFEFGLRERWEDMLRFLAESYGTLAFGKTFGEVFGLVVGVVVGLLLLSAVNTAIAALIGLLYTTSRDGEMPRGFARLNSHGVPWVPLLIATVLPSVVVFMANDPQALAGLYAIGVVGAIALNLGSCTVNKPLNLPLAERVLMGTTCLILVAVELTIARTKPDALFFVTCVLVLGLSLRGYAQRRAGLRTLTVSTEIAAAMAPESMPEFRLNLDPGQSILVAARGVNPVLRFALEEARLRKATLYVLYVKEIAVTLPGPVAAPDKLRWQDDKAASDIMLRMLALARENDVTVVPVYMVSDDPAAIILDVSATLGIDLLVLGTPHRHTMVRLLKGNVVTEVAKNLPENIQLIIYG